MHSSTGIENMVVITVILLEWSQFVEFNSMHMILNEAMNVILYTQDNYTDGLLIKFSKST